jgi:hypothetical protein
MKKIIITEKIRINFKNLVFSIFNKKNDKLHLKKENKKIKFDVTLEELNKLIYEKLKKFDKSINFEKLIIADFDYLKDLANFIDNTKYTNLSMIQKEYFYTLYERLKKPKFIEFLNVKTCLYCNRNFILNFQKKNNTNATAQLDHFFNKKDYPYLAVSLYNLIPCCSTCNLRKSNKQSNILHPYIDNIDKEIKFSLKIKNSKFYHSTDGFEININGKSQKAKNHIEMFNLQSLYNEHKDIILELIQKKYAYSDDYLEDLFKRYEGTFFRNKEDLLRLITGGYISESEINKRPLSKFIKDISEELGIWE